MANGEDTSKHPNRRVDRNNFGTVNYYQLSKDATGNQVGIDWATGDHESVPLNSLVHDDEDSPHYGKSVRIKHLKEATTRGGYGDRSNVPVARKKGY
jgi:hypothetical protein